MVSSETASWRRRLINEMGFCSSIKFWLGSLQWVTPQRNGCYAKLEWSSSAIQPPLPGLGNDEISPEDPSHGCQMIEDAEDFNIFQAIPHHQAGTV